MNCKIIQIQFPDLLGGNLSGGEKKILEAHLAVCPKCKEEYAAFSVLVARLNQDTSWTPPQSYWGALLPRIHERIERKSKYPGISLAWIQPVTVAAAVVALFIAGVKIFSPDIQESHFDVASIVKLLPVEELQTIAESRMIEGITEPGVSTAHNGIITADDKEILKELIDQEGNVIDEATALEWVKQLNDQTQNDLCVKIDQDNSFN